MSRFYITTPIYYINAEPHLGHAYTTIVADAIARSRRLLGDHVFFLTGTDEHGQKVERAARKAGMQPLAFADRIAALFRGLFEQLQISNDDFIRTTEPRHHAAAQAIWRRVLANGDIYKGNYEGWYCTVDEIFVPETQLAEGRRCPTCGAPVERVSEESYYFRLSKYQAALLRHYDEHPDFIRPEMRMNEMRTFVQSGLQDLSVSRTSFSWGVPVPDDPAHVMYVWFDALANYLTAAGFGSEETADEARFAAVWPANLHLMGKEIVRQHTVYWPAFLMAAGLPLPKQIVGHGWWLMNNAKMSKSIGNVVRPDAYTRLFGVDALRYFVLREMVLGQDASFSDDGFLTRYNADLANDLGNLASRAMTMIHRYRDGVVPPPGDPSAADRELIAATNATIAAVATAVHQYEFSRALADVWDLVGRTNRFIVGREPWALAKDPARRGELDAALYRPADTLRVIAALIEPAMPGAAQRLRRMLGVNDEPWTNLRAGTMEPGTRLGPIDALFPRMEHSVEELRQMASDDSERPAAPGGISGLSPTAPVPASAPAPPAAPAAPAPAVDTRLSIDEFMKIDLRVARVTAAERVPNSKKLIKLQVDVGAEQRTLVAGIADAYEPDALVGRSVVIVANLKPAKLMGIESNGMVLAASPEGGKPVLLGFEDAPPPGSRVR